MFAVLFLTVAVLLSLYAFLNSSFPLISADGSQAAPIGEEAAETTAEEEHISVAELISCAARLHADYHGGTAHFTEGSPWYQVYVEYALANGIIPEGEFTQLDRSATRRELAGILAHAYLLRGDYELYFVLIDGHVMMSMKMDGFYYLIDPVTFLCNPNYEWTTGHFRGYFEGVPVYADDLQTIADSMVQRGHTKTFHTYCATHDMLPQALLPTERGTDWVYPSGSEVTCWTPDTSSVSYRDVSPDYPYNWQTDCWMSESFVTPVVGIPLLPLPDYPGMF